MIDGSFMLIVMTEMVKEMGTSKGDFLVLVLLVHAIMLY